MIKEKLGETKLVRVNKKFDDLLNYIIRERLKSNKDERPKSKSRVTLAMVRHPLTEPAIAKDIINNDLKD